jgi:hypothetical protein
MSEIDRLRRDCAEAYQAVGALAAELGAAGHPDVVRLLDNLHAAAEGAPRPHDDLLPWPRAPISA